MRLTSFPLLPASLLPALALLALASLSAPAPAAPGDAGVVCSSNDRNPHQCTTPFRGPARLVENLSSTRCIEGSNWGSRPGQVWVSGGCRARFVEARGPGGGPQGGGTIRCESADRRMQSCRTGWDSAVLVRQLSDTRCVEGRNWGARRGEVWVNDGCRGEFAAGRGGPGGATGMAAPVTCSSDDNRQHVCGWDRRWGRPYLVRQLSKTRCVEGRTWGYDGRGLWVDDGCRGQFAGR
jgi:hypothetical protein